MVRAEEKVPLPGSERLPWPGAERIGPADRDRLMRVTVVLRRRAGGEPGAAGNVVGREYLGEVFGADPVDVERVKDLAREHGLAVEESNAWRRAVVLAGPAGAMAETFGAELSIFRTRRGKFRGRTGPVMAPAALGPRIMAVLGLDDRRAARSRARVVDAADHLAPFTPPELAKLYAFPAGLNGAGQTIGIVSLGGGYRASDHAEYFAGLGLAAPEVVEVSVNGARNQPGVDDVADRETALDVQIAGAIAPGARIAVYFAENSEQGFHDAISQAVHSSAHTPSVISLSWGGPEETWTQQLRDALGAALDDAMAAGVTVIVAAGDDGAADGIPRGVHVDLPACMPQVLSCGGTRAEVAKGRLSEIVWNDSETGQGVTGGGVSRTIPRPAWQSGAGVPAHPQTGFVGRGVPDVAANADPHTGYRVRIDGADQVVGGTSAVAPLWAGLIARINQRLGRPVGFINPLLYGFARSIFRDVVTGDNGAYKAGGRWDACTGLGSPNGRALAAALPAAIRAGGAG